MKKKQQSLDGDSPLEIRCMGLIYRQKRGPENDTISKKPW